MSRKNPKINCFEVKDSAALKIIHINKLNKKYLRTKKEKLGHYLEEKGVVR